jgi:hypothetical protein
MDSTSHPIGVVFPQGGKGTTAYALESLVKSDVWRNPELSRITGLFPMGQTAMRRRQDLAV